MSKYLNRLAAKLGRAALAESAKEGKSWIVSKRLIMETEEGDVETLPGETVEVGADENGDMAVKTGAAVVVITDPELATRIADIIVSSSELSDVNFVQRPALDAVMDGEEIDDVIDSLADDDSTVEDIKAEVEVPEVNIEKKESVEAKFAKFAKNDIRASHALVCEAIQIEECEDKPLNMYLIKTDRTMKESYTDYAKFAARVSELKGSLQPGKREIALSENGKVMGSFDKDANSGILFTEEEFDSVEGMDSFDDQPQDLMQEVGFDGESLPKPDLATLSDEDRAFLDDVLSPLNTDDFNTASLKTADEVYNRAIASQETNPAVAEMFAEYGLPAVWYAWKGTEQETPEVVEACLKKYEESAKTGADYMQLVKGLRGLKEATVAKIVATFGSPLMESCVRVYDSKYGKYCASFKESVSADNFIAETAEDKRFTKRFFA